VIGSHDPNNEPLSSIKGEEIFGKLNKYLLLKKTYCCMELDI